MSNLAHEWRESAKEPSCCEYDDGYSAALIDCAEQLETDRRVAHLVVLRGNAPCYKNDGTLAIYADAADAELHAARLRAVAPHMTYKVLEVKL